MTVSLTFYKTPFNLWTMLTHNQIVSNAKLWLNRVPKRSTDEKESYLFALQDAGVAQKTVDAIEDIFYP